jgi:hypothetical protein
LLTFAHPCPHGTDENLFLNQAFDIQVDNQSSFKGINNHKFFIGGDNLGVSEDMFELCLIA